MTERNRGPANRSHFERWLAEYCAIEQSDVRADRAEFGYENTIWDLAWAAWNAALNRHPRLALTQKPEPNNG